MSRPVLNLRSARLPMLWALLAFIAIGVAGLPHAGAQAQQATQGQPMQLPVDPDKLIIHTAQGAFRISIEIADKPGERERGLMFRRTMALDHGMLFVFDRTRSVLMWMKNTPMSLDMVFIRADGTVANVAERTEPFSEDVIPAAEPVAYVLELRAGAARMIGLKAGDRLEHRVFKTAMQ